MAYLAFLFFFNLMMVLRVREAINPFPDLPKHSFGSEDKIFIISVRDVQGDVIITILDIPVFTNIATTTVSMFTGVNI